MIRPRNALLILACSLAGSIGASAAGRPLEIEGKRIRGNLRD
jgi:hypothetical protein